MSMPDDPGQTTLDSKKPVEISDKFSLDEEVVLYEGDVRDLLSSLPDESVQLVVTSPPYNLGKEYEERTSLSDYREFHREVVNELVRVLKPEGSICWEIGNYVDDGEILPLDYIFHDLMSSHDLQLRNRIIWRFRHGLHCSKRFSGRHEVILWYTKSDDYVFNLDPVRAPQRYPNKKHYKGPNKGEESCHPLGKNPGDVWDIPNVKHGHPEKTDHPCQFPVELVERLVLALADEGDRVLDPFAGVGTTNVAAIKRDRKSIGAETEPEYAEIARERIRKMAMGELDVRPMHMPVREPDWDQEYLEKFVGGILD